MTCTHDRDSILEGAPCGYAGCEINVCCQEYWYQHCKIYHPEYYPELTRDLIMMEIRK